MVYGIPSHLFVTKQQNLFLLHQLNFGYAFNSLPNVLLEYLDRFVSFAQQ